ncbi:putative DNA binding domain-containing protein [Synergistaceae bacterium OttesenSCG-928-I11]|nr:putative DNA binding domain-containing protein [Synergistaceae bacterium OttesenSCG-928-I11]
MTPVQLNQLISEGEGLTVEFKKCTDGLNNSVFETVCSFSNRYGGYILLGVDDDGTVAGVNRNAVPAMKKNFVNMLNNPQKISPTLFLTLDEIEVDGKLVLYAYIPASSQVELCSGKVYDRTEDADIDITKSTDMVANLYMRKSASYTEREVFPYITEKELRLDLMPRVRQMALSHYPKHPWENMSDMEILKSAGLYERDWRTNEEGFNLAAVLLFGRDDVIRSCAPGYVTDAILRKENLDRYDDRLMVETNLIESYDLLMEFIAKHTLDRFFLIEDRRVSVRTWIAREIVSNSLVHREYSSPFPAKIIIERGRLYAENWNKARQHGRIDPDRFTPYPKNPLLAHFFVNIGRADKLGSGVRNLYYYTKLYSGGEPELIEGDVFKTIVPLDLSPTVVSDKVSDKSKMGDKVSDKTTNTEDAFLKTLLPYFEEHEWIDISTACDMAQKPLSTTRRYLKKLVDFGIMETSGGNRNRRYRLAERENK